VDFRSAPIRRDSVLDANRNQGQAVRVTDPRIPPRRLCATRPQRDFVHEESLDKCRKWARTNSSPIVPEITGLDFWFCVLHLHGGTSLLTATSARAVGTNFPGYIPH
jgi:hypothetical protein